MKKDLKLKSRDLDDALENIDYKKIMDSVCAKYSRSVDPDDISSLRLEILWKCLKSFDEDRGVKFTTFLYQQLKVKPKKGTVVIWPGSYTHLHRGNPPMSDKYIATGWYQGSIGLSQVNTAGINDKEYMDSLETK